MESAGLQGTPAHQVAVLADETGGVYSAETHGGVHRDSPKVLQMYFKKIFLKQYSLFQRTCWKTAQCCLFRAGQFAISFIQIQ